MPSSKRHLFFDLDRTLWDFDQNSENALRQIFRDEELEARIGGFEHFHQQYVYQNAHLWKLYGKGKIKKDDLRYERFRVVREAKWSCLVFWSVFLVFICVARRG